MATQDTPHDRGAQLADVFVIEDVHQLKVLASDLRIAILDHLIDAPLTVTDVGRLLGISPAKLYYHFSELELAGLIQVVEPEDAANGQHKYYRAVAKYYHLSSSLLRPSGHARERAAGSAFIIDALEHTVRQLKVAFSEGLIDQWPETLIVQRRSARMSAEQAQQFRDRLRELAWEFRALDREDGEVTMEFGFGLFPRPEPAVTLNRTARSRATPTTRRTRRRFPRRTRRV